MDKILTKDYINRLRVAIKYTDAFQYKGFWKIERIVPAYIRNLVLQGKPFKLKYDEIYGYVLFKDNKQIGVDMDTLNTDSTSFYAELRSLEDDGADCVRFRFGVGPRKWSVFFDSIEGCKRITPLHLTYEDANHKLTQLVSYEGGDNLKVKLLSGKESKLIYEYSLGMNDEDAEIMKRHYSKDVNTLSR